MLKKSRKILVVVIALIMLMATACYAEDVETVEKTDPVLLSTEPTDGEIVSTETSEDVTTGVEDIASKLDDMLNSDLFLMQEEVKYDKIVDGNAYIMGNTVTFDSIIGGNVFILGNEVTIDENAFIYASLYILANKVTIKGSVYGGDLYVACSELTIEQTGAVARDIRAAAGKFVLNAGGEVGGVGRNVYVTASEISVANDARILGDFNYTSEKAIEIPADVVDGKINFTQEISSDDDKVDSNPIATYFYELLQSLVMVLATLGLMILFAPGFLKKLEGFEAKAILPSLGIGAIGLLVGIPVLLIGLFSVIGIGIGFSLFSVWIFLAFVLSIPVSVISIAGLLAKKVEVLNKWHNIFAVIIIAIVIWALGLIPFVGGLLTFALYLYGFGLAVRTIWKNRAKSEEKAA